MKKIIALLICTLIILTLAVPCFAISSAPKVTDLENLLTDEEEKNLSAYLEEIGRQYDMDIAIITTPSLDGKDSTAFTDDYWDENGYAESGVMFMISLTEGYWYISTAGEAQTRLSNRHIDEIADAAIDYIHDGEYYDAFIAFADACDERLALNYHADTYYEDEYSGYYDDEKPAFNAAKTLGISLIVGFFVGWIIAAYIKSKLNSVALKKEANHYVKEGSFELTNQQDLLLYVNVTRTRIERDSDSGGHSGSGSSVHFSSGGSSHGGHGGRL